MRLLRLREPDHSNFIAPLSFLGNGTREYFQFRDAIDQVSEAVAYRPDKRSNNVATAAYCIMQFQSFFSAIEAQLPTEWKGELDKVWQSAKFDKVHDLIVFPNVPWQSRF